MYLQIYTNIHICIYIPTTLKPHNFEKQVTKRLEKVFNKGLKRPSPSPGAAKCDWKQGR